MDSNRHSLSALKLASFSLVDCAHSVLNERVEVLSSATLKQIWELCCTGDTKGGANEKIQYALNRTALPELHSQTLNLWCTHH